MGSARIRFVKCPVCMEILPEPPNVPIYQCGRCGKLLQAKIRKTDAAPTSSQEKATLNDVSTEKDCGSLSREGSLNYSAECSSDRNNGTNQLLSENSNGGELHAVRLPNHTDSDVSDQYKPEDDDQLGMSNGDIMDDTDKHELESPSNVKLSSVNVFDENSNNGNDRSESSCGVVEEHGVCNDGCSSTEVAQSENEELCRIEVAENVVAEAFERSKIQAHRNSKLDYDIRISNSDELFDEKETLFSSSHALDRLARESISSDHVSSANEELEPCQENAKHGFSRVTSTDAFGAADFANPSSELSGDLIDLSKSPISRSVRAYYDDGVSSCEGTDDQFPGRHQHTSKTPYKASNYAAYEERLKKEKFQANRSSELNHQFGNHAPYMSDQTRYTVISGEFLDDTRPINQNSSWGRLESDVCTSQLPFHQRGKISDPLQSPFRYNSSSHEHEQPAYSDHEKIKLLRMFYELQDQLNKTGFMNEKPNGRSHAVDNWKDHHIPMYYGREAFEEDFQNCSGYPGKFMEASNWPHVPVQGEATSIGHQVDYSMYRCPQVRQCSAQLPMTAPHPTNGFRKAHSGINFRSSYGSCPLNSQWHNDTEFPMYYRGTLSGDQRYRENAAKNFLRPVAGGAPFITCTGCFKLLQLPADFLLFKRRFHRVQCGACSELLRFSLIDGIHLVPYTPSVKAPPPSEVDRYAKAANGRHLAPAFHGQHSSEADQASSSDYYESYAPLEDRKKLGSGCSNKIFGIGSTFQSPGRRSGMWKGKKVSSESEEVSTDGGSPLHRLMGYSSASELIYNI